MQAYVNTAYTSLWYESRTGTAPYYSNSTFPQTNYDGSALEDLAYSYFDDYDLNQDNAADYTWTDPSLTGAAAPTTLTRGMLTITRKRTVGLATNVWLINVLFYDKRGNLIQNKSNNQLNYTAATSTNAEAVTDTKSSVPDFTGKPQLVRAIKIVASGTVNVITAFAYDGHNARLASIQQSYDNGGTYTTISAYSYNDLGQLVTKGLGGIPANADLTLGTAQSVASGSTSNVTATNSIVLTGDFSAANGSTFSATIVPPSGPTSIAYYLQNLDYRYNIRGQLTNINNSTLTNDGGLTNSDSNDVFGMTLLYDQPDISGATASYTGRISEAKWMSQKNGAVNSPERSYVYSYDPVNRLTDAIYADRVGTGSWGNADLFSEKGIHYDENGNLTALVRYANGSIIDNLTYTQSGSNPNQLASVNDASNVNYGVPGGNGTYTSDANSGNLTIDAKKGLNLTYNELNKTNTITQTAATSNVVTYGYDASGTVIRKQVAGGTAYTNDYLDGFVYQNGVLQYFAMPEGRVTFNPTNGTYTPQYVIADNQGNARITFQDSGTGTVNVMQENGYYAFGMVMPTNFVSTSGLANNNLYNGQNEWQNDYNNLPDYYQTFYRNYDAALGRFIGVDPQAESAASMTTYQYAGNNPVMMNDPMGNVSKDPMLMWTSGVMREMLANSGGHWSAMDSDNPIYWSAGDADQYVQAHLGTTAYGGEGLGLTYTYDEKGNLKTAFMNGTNWSNYQVTTNTAQVNVADANDIKGGVLLLSWGVGTGANQEGEGGIETLAVLGFVNDRVHDVAAYSSTGAMSAAARLSKSTEIASYGFAVYDVYKGYRQDSYHVGTNTQNAVKHVVGTVVGAGYGAAIGSTAGALIGGAIGTLIGGPIGTGAGAYLGAWAGGIAGAWVGGWAGGEISDMINQ